MKHFSVMYYKTFIAVIVVLILQALFNLNSATGHGFGSIPGSGRSIETGNYLIFFSNDSLSKDDYNMLIREALDYQLVADSLSRLAKTKRGLLREIRDPGERIKEISEISRLEQESENYREKADERYKNTFIYENQVNEAEKADEKIRLVRENNGIKVYQYAPAGDNIDIGDTLVSAPGLRVREGNTALSGQTRADEFDILEMSPYNDHNPIPSDIRLPAGLIFRIQSGVYSKAVPNDTYGGLTPLSYIWANGKFKYFIGIFYSSNSANNALTRIREYGFNDAFIVPFYDGRIITIEKAKEIEYSQIKL